MIMLILIIIFPAIKLNGNSANNILNNFDLKSLWFKKGNILINMLFIKKMKSNKKFNLKFHFIKAPVAQLDRALGYGPGGSGFKS